MTPLTWARRHGACPGSLRYLRGKGLSWGTWIGSCGEWRSWACLRLDIASCSFDLPSWRGAISGEPCHDPVDVARRARLNEPATYQALRHHWETVVLPAFRKAGVR